MKTEHLNEIQRKNLEASLRLAKLSIENSQRIMALQSDLARSLFEESVASARSMTAVKGPQEAMEVRAKFTQETAQLMMAAAQRVASIGNEARLEFSRLLTEQLASGSHEMMDSFQTFFKALPGQNPDVASAMEQAMGRANAAFEQIIQASSKAFGGGDAAEVTAARRTPAASTKAKK